MPSGIQVWDPNGNILVDASSSAVKILATITLTSTDGSVTNAGLQPVVDGKARFLFITVPTSSSGSLFDRPVISRSGTTVSWSWPNSASKPPYKLIYGYY